MGRKRQSFPSIYGGADIQHHPQEDRFAGTRGVPSRDAASAHPLRIGTEVVLWPCGNRSKKSHSPPQCPETLPEASCLSIAEARKSRPSACASAGAGAFYACFSPKVFASARNAPGIFLCEPPGRRAKRRAKVALRAFMPFLRPSPWWFPPEGQETSCLPSPTLVIYTLAWLPTTRDPREYPAASGAMRRSIAR